jgi:succinoglycan biosynthesis protein ExoM
LKRLLSELDCQNTDGLFSYAVVVVDNDRSRSAQQVVESFQKISNLDVQYYIEPEQNIALARNRAVENAKGNFVAFIDDDEFPSPKWLLDLINAYNDFKADGILGPVLPFFEKDPPKWIIDGHLFERPSHKTGTVLNWTNCRTGNVLLSRDIFDIRSNMFRQEFGSGGEDRDFFRRMISQGRKFVWCNEAHVFETVSPERYKISFMLRRALLRGKIPYNQNLIGYIESLIAIPLYTLILPFLLLGQYHVFINYLIKYFDHIGRLLALLGINVIKEKYILK